MNTISPFRIVLIFLTIAALAFLVLPRLRLDLVPQENSHNFTVSFTHWNSSPDAVEDQVTSVLENAFSKIRGLQKISSSSGYGYGQVQLDFPQNTDLTLKQFELSSIIRQIYPRLPANTSYPALIFSRQHGEESHTPALIYTIKAPEQPFQIRQIAEEIIVKKLSATPGLQDASLTGTEPLQIEIRFDNEVCQTFRIPPARIIEAIQSTFSTTYPGMIGRDGHQYFIRVPAPAAEIPAIEQITISNGRTAVRVRDLATVSLKEQSPHSYFRIDGENAINLSIYIRKNENALVVADRFKKRIRALGASLPAGYSTALAYDETEYLQKEIDKNYKRALLSICILSTFIFLAYRNWKYLFILSCSLFVNVCMSTILAWLFKIDIHLYTIAGIAIVFGIMTDNAIIVLDYCHQSYGRKIFPALLSATATIIAALGLIFFLPESEKKSLYDFSLIIILGLVSSLIIALLFIPALYQLVFHSPLYQQADRMPPRKRQKWKIRNAYYRSIGTLAKFRPAFIILVILLFGTPIFLLPYRLEEGREWYRQWYNNTLGSRKYEKQIRPYVDKGLGGALRLFTSGMHQHYGYRSFEKTKLYIGAELPVGSTLEQMNSIMTDLDNYIHHLDGIETYVTNINSGQYGGITITFTDSAAATALPYRIRSKIIGYTQDLGGVECSVNGVGEGFSNGSDEDQTPSFTVVMKGYNYSRLENQARLFGEELSQQERVEKINTDDHLDPFERKGKEYMLDLEDERMSLLNTNKAAILQGLQTMAASNYPSTSLLVKEHIYPLTLEEKNSAGYSSFDILNNYMPQDSSRAVRLGEMGSIRLYTTASAIHKENRQYIRNISFTYIGSYQAGVAYLDKIIKKFNSRLPAGFSMKRQILKEENDNASKPYLLILLLLGAVFFICGILFESLKKPFCIIAAIPVSFIGIFLVFSTGDFYFDQGGYAAFVMLGGLVANASIFIVNDVIQLQRQHKRDPNRTMIRAVFNRSRTILLTNLATCCGLIPYLPGGSHEVFWFSFAIGTLGGLLFSLFSLFVFLPVLLWKKRKPEAALSL